MKLFAATIVGMSSLLFACGAAPTSGVDGVGGEGGGNGTAGLSTTS